MGFFSGFSLRSIYTKLLYIPKDERVKVILLALSFFCIIGTYTIVRTLKDSLFTSIVGGREYLSLAKLWSMVLLIPAILLFSKLVDVMRRAHLLTLYSLIYGMGGLIIGYYIAHPTIGLPNTQLSPDRLFGWIVYFFLDGFNPFVVGLFWSFTHSITSPTSAKSNYPIMVSASKLGGVVLTSLACWWLNRVDIDGQQVLTDAVNYQMLFYATSFLLLLVPIFLVLMIILVPSSAMHGYEAAYKFEKKHAKEEKTAHTGWWASIKKNIEGLILMVRYPYVMGILGVVSFWEVVNVFVNIERVTMAGKASLTDSQKASFLLYQDFWVHMVGFVITLLGTRALIEYLGERRALLLVPGVTAALMVYYFTAGLITNQAAAVSVGIAYILLKALNYAFASPLRESLYIPTTKLIKFKSKSWIDSFGTKFAKSVGATYSGISANLIGTAAVLSNSIFFAVIIGLWMIVANLLGRRYEVAVEKGEVIGSDESKD
jgi:AAA family ATP:ADP antiporter